LFCSLTGPHLYVSIEGAGLREDLPAVRANDAVDAVGKLDVPVQVGQRGHVATQRAAGRRGHHQVDVTALRKFALLAAVVFVMVLKIKHFVLFLFYFASSFTVLSGYNLKGVGYTIWYSIAFI
jgi:hypothetical protein